MLKQLNQPISRRTVGIVLGLLLLTLALIWGGRSIYRHLARPPLSTAEVREAIWEHLETQAGQDEFKPVAAGLTNLLAYTNGTAGATNLTKKELKLKKKLALNPRAEVARQFQKDLAQASDYRTIYRLIAEQLLTAEQWLDTPDEQRQESGLLVAVDANRAALHDAFDPWLAARICEGYLWPYLETAEASQKDRLDAESLLNVADKSFREAGETDHIIRNYQLLIRKAPKSKRADQARYRLSRLYEDQQNFRAALRVLQEVQNTTSPTWSNRVAAMSQRLQSR